MKTYIISCIGFLAFFCHITLQAQIVSTGHNSSVEASYSVDSIYLYADLQSAGLSAVPPSGATNLSYSWKKFESGNWVESETNTHANYTGVLKEGAYRVSILDDGTQVAQHTCWLFVPEITSVEIDTLVNTCSSLQLTNLVNTKDIEYSDPKNGTAYTLEYQLEYEWTWNASDEMENNTEAQPEMSAPLDTVSFTLTVSAFNGISPIASESLFFDPIAVKSDFTFNVTDRGNENEFPTQNSYSELTTFSEASSEVDVSINNNSLGGITVYDWYLIKDDELESADRDEGKNPNFSITELGSYQLSLVTQNTIRGCKDSISVGPITLKEMNVEAPNVFTPDGDGSNDVFRVAYTSVKDFKMVIFNSWGRKVFETSDPGDSWDGKIGSQKAAEGVYFYFIEARGYNEKEEVKLKGPLHLFRGE